MNKWVRRSLNAGALTAGALLASGAAAQASPTMVSSDNIGLLNGTQANVPVQVPVNVCGNALAVLGGAAAECEGGATALNPEWRFHNDGAGTDMTSTGNIGLLNGTQANVPVQVPVNVCGNAVAVLGVAAASCDGGAHAGPEQLDSTPPGYEYEQLDSSLPGYGYGQPEAGTTMISSGNLGLLNGTQALVPVQVPIDICGNAVGVLGLAKAGCEGGATAR